MDKFKDKWIKHRCSAEEGSNVIKIRYIQVALLFFALVISFSIRVCLSVAIVAMTKNGTSSNDAVPYYDWKDSNIILSSFYWSYAALQFFAGHLAHYFGTKKMLLAAIFVNASTSALIPISAQLIGAKGVMALRIMQGLFQGFLLPCLNGMLGRWLPPAELSFLNSIIFSGAQVGVIFSTMSTGYLSGSWWGWPAAFYLNGVLGCIWCIAWVLFSAESPATHRSITMEERKYIEHSLNQQDDHLIDEKSIPWRAILRSLPYWAIIFGAIGESWTTTLMTAELPSYLSYAVGLNIEDSGLFTAAPTIGGLVCSLIYGPIGGWTIEKKCISKVNSRRIFHGYSLFSIAIGLSLISFFTDKATIAGILIASMSAASGVTCGHIVNHIDLSPRYAGILSGFSNGIGQLIAIFAPILVHFIVYDETDKTLWSYMFITAAIIGAVTAIFFMLFCSAERQWWDDIDKKKIGLNVENAESSLTGENIQCKNASSEI